MGILSIMGRKEMAELAARSDKTGCCLSCGNTLVAHQKKYCSSSCAGLAKRNRKTVICVYCGVMFDDAISGKRKYCSKSCANNKREEAAEKECRNCGTKFISQNGFYCSMKCAVEHKNKTTVTQLVFKTCEFCGREFFVHIYRTDTAKFCSHECHYRSKEAKKRCEECGNYFSGPRWKVEARRFCGKKCAAEHMGKVTHNRSSWERDVFNAISEKHKDAKNNTPLLIDGYVFYPDIVRGSVIIECMGDYWHCNPAKYKHDYYQKNRMLSAEEIWMDDAIRADILASHGYLVVFVWESDYSRNPDLTTDMCISALSYAGNSTEIKNMRFDALASGYTDLSKRQRVKKHTAEHHRGSLESPTFLFHEVDSLGNSNRGGFGSTGN